MKQKKSALINSLISLLLCFSMLVGTTFAWFTDSVTTGINTIAAGNLDVELYHSNAAVKDERVSSSTKLFMDLQGEPILWEPGVVSYENLRVTNAGDLALAYRLAINTANENYVVEESGAQYGLSQILKVGVVEGGITASERTDVVASVDAANWTTLADFMRSGSLLPEGAGESEKTWGVVIYWEPGENDNFWNLNNGKKLSSGDVLTIELGVNVVATQEQYESDAFGDDYDTTAKADVFPDFVGGSASAGVVADADNKTSAQVQMSSGQVAAVVPVGVKLADGTTELQLTVAEMNGSGANIVLGENEALRSLDVHIAGVAEDNTVPMTITIAEAAPIGLNMGNYRLYHVEGDGTKEMTLIDSNADFTAHNQFKYDPATGDITLYMATFSEVALTVNEENAWNGTVAEAFAGGSGTESDPYIISNADQLAYFGEQVGNGTTYANSHVNLIADINLGYGVENHTYTIFYPIGYYYIDGKSSVNSFEGTFDGQGHTIGNFYQNTWEIAGDYDAGYYKDAMGLFGYVNNGTVKNLTVDNFSSDGEFTPTGVIAAYADGNATFANIAITNCNPRVYNTGNGGIIGIAGNSNGGDKITLTNITVDNSNKISALWGSWDVACGGLVGMFRGNDKGSTISFTNCHVAAQIDVYNDVCANYQYYAYRYAGMIIGSVRNNTTTADGKSIPNMAGITATGCTVNYGDWNDYYYCEFEKNTMASYSEDYQFSRVPHSKLNFTDSNGNGVVDANERASVTGCKHTHTAEENHQAIYLPFNQLFTGYGWGVNSVGLKEYGGIYIEGVSLGDQEESVEKFETKFTGDFLYRVGNANTVKAGVLFSQLTEDVVDSGVYVSVTSMENDLEVMGSYKPNTEDWSQGEITFTKTGPVKVTIQDYNYCEPTVLYLEVVDAYNVTATSEENRILTGWNRNANNVLLEDVEIASNGTLVLWNGNLYGNSFTLEATNAAYSGVDIDANSYVINVKNSEIDNVTIKGAEYPSVGATKDQDYYRPLLFVTGTDKCTITNSVLSGTASPIRSGCDLELVNVILDGGVYANLDMRGGQLVLDNVTTINQGSTTEPFGLGIVVYQEGGSEDMSITIKNALNQYNYISSKHAEELPTGYAKTLVDEMFKNDYKQFQYTDSNSVVWVNTGIISMNNQFDGKTDIIDQRADGHGYDGFGKEITQLGNTRNCYVYTFKPSANSLEETPGTGTTDQNVIAPTTTFNHTVNNVIATEEQPNDYCSTDGNMVTISMDQGDAAFNWNPVILNATKSGKTLGYTASVTVDGSEYIFNVADNGTISATKAGVAYTDTTIPFGVEGEYTVTYSFTDPYNFAVNDDGDMVRYDKSYEETLTIKVIEVEPSARHAVFSFGTDGTEYTAKKEVVTMTDGSTRVYVMPNVEAVESGKIGSTTVNGKTVYYPITNMYTSDGKTAHTGSWYACFPIFKDAVQIIDYADKGTGASVTYNQKNVTTVAGIPSALKAVNPTSAFLYSMNATNYPPPTEPTAVSGAVCYTCNRNGLTSSNTRNEMTVVAEYTYKDNAGTQYYYYVGYYCVAQTKGSTPCVTSDTLVTLVDGSQKRIDEVTYEDQLLVWNFYEGCYTAAPSSIIENHGYNDNNVIKLIFEDGTAVKIVNLHGFFDVDLNKWVDINAENAESFIGHRFVQVDGDSYKTVELTDVAITEEYCEAWGILTVDHYNCIAENMFSIVPPATEQLAFFEIGEDMTYDEAKMQADIEKYGLYTYEEFEHLMTYDAFEAFNVPEIKVAVGKGMITYDEVLALIQTYA